MICDYKHVKRQTQLGRMQDAGNTTIFDILQYTST